MEIISFFGQIEEWGLLHRITDRRVQVLFFYYDDINKNIIVNIIIINVVINIIVLLRNKWPRCVLPRHLFISWISLVKQILVKCKFDLLVFLRTEVPKLPWIRTHLRISWPSGDPLNDMRNCVLKIAS